MIIREQDLSHTLKDFYQNIRNTFANTSKKEKEENKKFYSEIKHESDVFLKLGGDKYMGFTSLIMRETN
jgi:hypothetical protein